MKILVTAASKHGATAQIAAAVGAYLSAAGNDVDVRAPDRVRDLDGVDGVVLGSAVYAGRWLKPARDLATRLGPEVGTRPVWMFSSGPVGDPLKPVGDAVDVAAAASATSAREHRVFAGRVDTAELALGERLMVRAFGAAVGDFRDWDTINAWAEDIDRQLKTMRR